MVILPNGQDLTAASGLINIGFLENVYHSIIDETFVDLGRRVVFHLQPSQEQDVVTQSKPQAQQYNPFFGRVGVPNTNTRNPGTKITPRDVIYDAHIRIGPMKEGTDTTGMGDLKANEAMITVVIEAMQYIDQIISISIEGRRYSVMETRPIGFSSRRYIMMKLEEINEREAPSTISTDG
jgi:hypothetical protein